MKKALRKPERKRVLTKCPCGSGKEPVDCHVDAFDGRLRKHVDSLRPPGPATGHSHPKCYLRETNDCSHKLSREHYISESLLEQLGEHNAVRVTGMPWQRADETDDIGISSLTAKILCDRHNNSLSPLDSEAALFFYTLRTALSDLDRKTLSRKPIDHLVSGEALELWMLKVACGLYHSIGMHDRVKLSTTHSIDIIKVQRAFFEREWDSRGGLYFKGSIGSRIVTKNSASFAPLSLDARFGGTTISLLGFELDLVFDTTGANPGAWPGLIRRPTELLIRKAKRQHAIILTWPPGNPEMSIHFEQKISSPC